MPSLLPCSACNRHIRRAELACPFCQEPVQSAAPQRSSSTSKLAQAAILAGSLAGASACTGGTDDKIDASQQSVADADPAAPDADPTRPDARAVPDARPVPDANPNQLDAMPPLPYGAPPARRRLV